MHDITRFTLKDMTECGAHLRRLGEDASSMEETADRIVRYLHTHLTAGDSRQPACALVRFFKTHPYNGLDVELRRFADSLLDRPAATDSMRCMTLLATAGDREEWNSRARSAAHKAIPLPSRRAIAEAPMIAELIDQLGLESGALVAPGRSILIDAEQRTYNVFYVPDARRSENIPHQDDFVVPFGIRSVLGFGGVLPLGDLFAVIMFSKVLIPRETTELFKPLALHTKVAVLPFVAGPVFA